MASKLAGIQLLRAVATIGVVTLHFSEQVGLYGHGAKPFLVRHGLAGIGASGVDIFFVISGFIMYYTCSTIARAARQPPNFCAGARSGSSRPTDSGRVPRCWFGQLTSVLRPITTTRHICSKAS